VRDVGATVDRWHAAGEEIALATLVRVSRAAPRLPGARLAVTRTGHIVGSVSGGCVESDVATRAMGVLEDGRCAFASYGIPDESGLTDGPSCGATIDVLIEPFAATTAWRALRDAIEDGRAAALALAFAPPSLAGRQLVVSADAIVGTIDRKVDAEAVDVARRLLETGGAHVTEVAGASVFFEAFLPPEHLVVVGATHVAMPLCRMARELGRRVTVVDPRRAFATEERFPDVDRLVREWPEDALPSLGLDERSSVVVLTHDPKFDLPALEIALRSGARYVGALGSRRTHERRRSHLRAAGLTEADVDRIHAPVGLDLGAESPAEIALAILAEMTAVRRGRDGRSLRERRGSIHDDR